MKRFAAGFAAGILVTFSLACAGAAAPAEAPTFELLEVNYDTSIRIGDMTEPTIEIHPGWVIFDDPSWGERFMVPERKVNWIRLGKAQ